MSAKSFSPEIFARFAQKLPVCKVHSTYLILGTEHEMINDQLLPTLEEVGESYLPIGTSESIFLIDLDHGEVAELGIELVVGAESGFLFDEESFAGCEPFGRGHDLRWKSSQLGGRGRMGGVGLLCLACWMAGLSLGMFLGFVFVLDGFGVIDDSCWFLWIQLKLDGEKR
jgi:hypothetical protein